MRKDNEVYTNCDGEYCVNGLIISDGPKNLKEASPVTQARLSLIAWNCRELGKPQTVQFL